MLYLLTVTYLQMWLRNRSREFHVFSQRLTNSFIPLSLLDLLGTCKCIITFFAHPKYTESLIQGLSRGTSDFILLREKTQGNRRDNPETLCYINRDARVYDIVGKYCLTEYGWCWRG
ncbi:hypothetical protein U3516DRAFT_739913 [Neocallimastix sp. 'constans']